MSTTVEERLIACHKAKTSMSDANGSKPYIFKSANGSQYVTKAHHNTIRSLTTKGYTFEPISEDDIKFLRSDNCRFTLDDCNGKKAIQISKKFGDIEVRRFYIESENTAEIISAAGFSVHEVIDGKKPSAIVIDIDFKREMIDNQEELEFDGEVADPETIEEFIEGVKIDAAYLIDSLNVDKYTNASELIEYGYETDKKVSRHIIFPNAVVQCGNSNKAFIKILVATIERRSRLRDIKTILDPVGNNGTWFMRMPNCSKDGDYFRTLLPISENAKYYSKFPRISRPGSIPNIDLCEFDGTDEVKEYEEADTAAVTKLLEVAKTFYPNLNIKNRENWQGKKIFINYKGGFTCCLCQRVHDNAPLTVTSFKGMAKLCCTRAIAERNNYSCIIRSTEGYKGELLGIKQQKVEVQENSDDFNAMSGATVIDSRFVTQSIDDDFTSSYIISSVWGSGKSFFISRAINNARENNIPVICISSRVTLSIQQVESWGLVDYSTIHGKLDITKNPFTNWQIESVGMRVNPDGINGALIIVDEVTALSHHCANESSELGYSRRAGLNILCELIRNCNRYIVSDNDINDMQIKALTLANNSITPKVYKNINSKYEGKDLTIYVHSNANEAASIELFDKLMTNFYKFKAGQKVDSFYITHHSKKQVENFVDRFKKSVEPEFHYLIAGYTSDTSREIKEADFKNATTAWKDKLCVIASPTVSIGISAELDNFTEVYGVFTGALVSAEQSAQALMRCRSASKFYIYLSRTNNYDGPMSTGFTNMPDGSIISTESKQMPSTDATDKIKHISKFPENKSEFMKWVNRDNVPRDISGGFNYLQYFNPFKTPEAAEQYLDSFVCNLYVSAKIQEFRSRNNFFREITRIFNRAKFNIVVSDFEIKPVKTILHDETVVVGGVEALNTNAKISKIMTSKRNADNLTNLTNFIISGAAPESNPELCNKYYECKKMLYHVGYNPDEIFAIKDFEKLSNILAFSTKHHHDFVLAQSFIKFNENPKSKEARRTDALIRTDGEIYPMVTELIKSVGINDYRILYDPNESNSINPEAITALDDDNNKIVKYFKTNYQRLFGKYNRCKSNIELIKSIFGHVGLGLAKKYTDNNKRDKFSYTLSFAKGYDPEKHPEYKIIRKDMNIADFS